MKNKSLSPRVKSAIKNSRIVLNKLQSLKQLPSPNRHDSIINLNSPDSHTSLSNSHLNSQISSSSKINLKLMSPSPKGFLNLSTQNKLKTIASKYPAYKTTKSFQQNIGEHLLPLASDTAAVTFGSVLAKHELMELEGYSFIYYLGLKAKKSMPVPRKNYLDYDDKETDYIIAIGDHIAFQYEIIEILGSGSFAQVCKCWDHKNKKEVAIKIIKSHKRFHDQGQVELKVLGYLLKNDKNIDSHFVKMIEYFFFRRHLCIVFELLSFNLYELLKANQFKGFSLTLIRRFTLQILNGLSFLKAHDIIHCDLKPENIILINPTESLIKIIDFGSSCFEDEKVYYYIQSRIYRAPEIILGINYTAAIDIWSLGCIIVELFTGVPLFLGESETDQLFAIMEVLGCPPESVLKNANKRNKFFHSDGSPRSFVNSKGKVRVPSSKKIEEKIQTNDQAFLDFVKRCLEWAPLKRITPDEALAHPWIQQMKKIKTTTNNKNTRSPRVRIN